MNSQEQKKENYQQEMVNFMGDDTQPFTKQLFNHRNSTEFNHFPESSLNLGINYAQAPFWFDFDESPDQRLYEQPFEGEKTEEKLIENEEGYEKYFIEKKGQENQDGGQEERKGSEMEQENSQDYLAKLTPKTEAQKYEENIS